MNALLFVLLALFWGLSFLAIRVAIEGVPPFWAAGLRTFIAAAALLVLALARGIDMPKGTRLRFKLAALGLVNFAVPWAALFWGEQYVLPAVASIINSTVPLFVFVLSIPFLADERRDGRTVMGMALGFAGIVLVFFPAVRSFSAEPLSLAGMAAILLMAIAYSVGAIAMKRLHDSVNIVWNLVIQGVSASAALFVLASMTEGTAWVSSVPSYPRSVVSVLYLALVSTALAWLIYNRLLGVWGALRASAVTFLIPVVAVVADWLALKSRPGALELLGGASVLAGIFLLHFLKHQPVSLVTPEGFGAGGEPCQGLSEPGVERSSGQEAREASASARAARRV